MDVGGNYCIFSQHSNVNSQLPIVSIINNGPTLTKASPEVVKTVQAIRVQQASLRSFCFLLKKNNKSGVNG